ncbi:kynureninase [Subtercola lobariae]|uniref:Kynureninase n=1 Tax=Subtercola lobariae TaxID=1588641 RepID=A0A917EYX9_9MICO|nr:aminotransferase class V-fold PLP-dependent enzyme [Subtercola lobariae]GGF26716.1 kynureninase [Subtercola lobariae]
MPDSRSRRAADLDAADPLASSRALFVGCDEVAGLEATPTTDVVSYLDGNSLGRPLKSVGPLLAAFVDDAWGDRLIRGWDEEWMQLPTVIGDELAAAALGAAPGQTLIGDSTTVLLYKLLRAAVAARPGRTEIVVDTDNFPTDRYLVEGIARERGLTVRWVTTTPDSGLSAELLAAALSDRTAVVLVSHVAYRSGFLADLPELTRLSHEAGALIVADLCHSVGSVPLELDAWGVDIAVGCTYKYLNGGPGSPAFVFVRADLQAELQQPIQGWLGHAEPFAMGPSYQPAHGMRRFQSGTPPVVGMLAMREMIALIASVGIRTVRQKSVALTEFAIGFADEVLAPLGVEVTSPRDAAWRGGHITLDHPQFKRVVAELWQGGVIPDFRAPFGLRVGLSPLSTSFAEVAVGLDAVRDALTR